MKNTKLANCSNGATAAAKQTLHPTGRSSPSYTSLCYYGAAAVACVDDDTAADGCCDIDVDVAAKDVVVAVDADRRHCVVGAVAAGSCCWCPADAAGGFAHDSRP